MQLQRMLTAGVCLLALGVQFGCDSAPKEPPLGLVKGKVTLDGQPGANLTVTFEPQTTGSEKGANLVGGSSMATTDAGGNYELNYKGGMAKGAAIGSHKVRVSSAAGGGPAGGANAQKQVSIPAQYSSESKISKDVKAGDNTIDLEIKSK